MPKRLNHQTFRNTALALTSVMLRYPHAAEALSVLLAERISEILPVGEFEVEACGGIVNIQGTGRYAGSSMASMSVLLLGVPGEISDKLDKIFVSEGEEVQQFLTDIHGEPWPAQGAKPHVRVTRDTVQLWWGGPIEGEALVKLRPISRQELGL